MLHLRNINPMVRAVGTMGAVSALVGGITFAQLTSNTVALSSNTLSTASAHLKIGLTNDNVSGPTTLATTNRTTVNTEPGCSDAKNGSVPGFHLTGSNGLVPGQASDPLNFCLKNTGGLPLDLSVTVPSDAFGDTTSMGITPADVTLDVTCDNSDTATGTLQDYESTVSLGDTALAAGDATDCSATVTLASDFNGSGTGSASLPAFDIQFMGTQSTTQTP